jgi:hypothetical protein
MVKIENDWSVGMKDPGDPGMSMGKTLPFSGRIYIYHEGMFTTDEDLELRNKFKSKNLNVILRDIEYVTKRKQ